MVFQTAALVVHANAGAVLLDEKNFVEETERSGKAAFVKFFVSTFLCSLFCLQNCFDSSSTAGSLVQSLPGIETYLGPARQRIQALLQGLVEHTTALLSFCRVSPPRVQVVIGDVDCVSHASKSICSEKGVKGFPTLKYFNGAWRDYRGSREFDALKDFVENALSPGCRFSKAVTDILAARSPFSSS